MQDITTRSNLPDNLVLFGNTDLLDRNPVLILNSRQSKTPVGNDPWVTNTIRAVRRAVENNQPVISSIGMNTWELNLWTTSAYGGSAIIIAPLIKNGNPGIAAATIQAEFNLPDSQSMFIFVPVPKSVRTSKSWWCDRDRIAFDLAATIIPLSVKPSGNLQAMIDNLNRNETSITGVNCNFSVEYRPDSHSPYIDPDPTGCIDLINWNHLTHWTKRTYNPWPSETRADFYNAIASSIDTYPRSAFDTLLRILGEKTIRGSGDRIRGGSDAVSFTSLEPRDALPLMRWRRRHVKPTFEPYGIAIHYRSALRAGLRPVVYVKSGEKIDTPAPEFFQGYGTGNWPKEKEWRAIGDVDLSAIPHDDITILAPSEIEAEKIRSMTGYKVIALFENLFVT